MSSYLLFCCFRICLTLFRTHPIGREELLRAIDFAHGVESDISDELREKLTLLTLVWDKKEGESSSFVGVANPQMEAAVVSSHGYCLYTTDDEKIAGVSCKANLGRVDWKNAHSRAVMQ